MPEYGRLLMIVGLATFVLGLAMVSAARLSWFGNLPGDIHWQRDNVSIFIPVGSMIVVSIVLSLVLNLVARLWR